eukprot:Anaeramoba_flamelloidesa810856_135.p1 GENE.a810856_135~~a810856_135.p1  ORF type:complete len:414 (-),score=113.73 a810856_135:63-1304(-)
MDPLYILEIGAHTTKFGLFSTAKPKHILQSVTGVCKLEEKKNKKVYGEEIDENLSGIIVEPIIRPTFSGVLIDWDQLEEFLDYLLIQTEKDGIDRSDLEILNSRSPYFKDKDDETLTEIMFEKFGIDSFNNGRQPLFSLISSSTVTGLLVDIGELKTRVTPYYKGTILYHYGSDFSVGGAHLSQYLSQLMCREGLYLNDYEGEKLINDFKSNYSFAGINEELEEKYSTFINIINSESNNEKKKNEQKNIDEIFVRLKKMIEFKKLRENCIFTDFAGRKYSISKTTSQFVEPLFQPGIIGKTEEGLQNTISKVIKNCDLNIRGDLVNNIVFTGSTARIAGIQDRLFFELQQLVPQNAKIGFYGSADESLSYFSWLGGCLCGRLWRENNSFLIDKHTYQEEGKQIVHQKIIESVF